MTWLCRGERLVVFLECLGLRDRLRVRLGSTRVENWLVILLEWILLVETVVDREVAMDVPEENQKLCQGFATLWPLGVIVGSGATRGKKLKQMTNRPLNRTSGYWNCMTFYFVLVNCMSFWFWPKSNRTETFLGFSAPLCNWNISLSTNKKSLSLSPPMAAITRLAKPSSSISYLRRCLSSAVSSETNPLFSSRKDPKDRNVQWVFLGCPGVGKGTYASRLCNLLGVPHIATGDLVREELTSSGPLSQQVLLSRSLIYLLELVLLWILITIWMIFLWTSWLNGSDFRISSSFFPWLNGSDFRVRTVCCVRYVAWFGCLLD